MRLHELLREMVEARGISVRELARRLGNASPTTVGKWLTDEGDPRLSELRALAAFFAVPLGQLLSEEGPAPEGLADDERMVLELYRSLKPELDHRDALRALALTRASAVATTAPAPPDASPGKPHVHGPAKFLTRQDLTDSDAQRAQERRAARRGRPKDKQ